MKRKNSIIQRLIFIVVFIVISLSSLAIYNYSEISRAKKNAKNLFESVIKPNTNLNNIRNSYLRGIETVVRQLASNDIDNDEARNQIIGYQSTINRNWKEYYQHKKYSSSKNHDSLIRSVKISKSLIENKLDLLLAALNINDKDAIVQFSSNNLDNDIKENIVKLNQLIKVQEKESDFLIKKNTTEFYSKSSRFRYLLLAIIIVTIILSIILIKDTRNLLRSSKSVIKKLQKSEFKFRSVFEHSGDGMFIIDVNQKFIDANPEFLALIGYSRYEVLGRDLSELKLFLDENFENFIIDSFNDLNDQNSKLGKFKILHKNTSVVHIELSLTLLNKTQVLCVVRDLSRRLKEKEEKKMSNKKYEIAIKNSIDAIVISSYPQGEIIETNKAFKKIFGFKKNDVIGKKWSELDIYLNKEDLAEIEKRVAHDKLVELKETAFRMKNDEKMIAHFSANLFTVDDQTFLYKVIHNISEIKNFENKLAIAETRIEELVNSTDTAIWEIDTETQNVSYVSPAIERLFGFSQKSWYESHFWENHIHPEDKEKTVEIWKTNIKKGKPFSFEYRFLNWENEVIWIRDKVYISYENGKPKWFRGILTDFTVEVKKELELKETTSRLELATKAANIGIFEVDLINKSIIWDATCYNMFGVDPETFSKTVEGFTQCIHPEDIEKLTRDFNDCLLASNEFYSTYRIILPTKEIRYIHSIGVVERNSLGKKIRATGMNRDVTESILAKEQILDLNTALEEKVAQRTLDLELANKNITDSLRYARNIQIALLPKEDYFKQIFQESFILLKPKDAVSGDFYWCHSDEKYKYLAVVDCTGHGVPGAFISIVAREALDLIVKVNHIDEPNTILANLDELIVEALHHKTHSISDGMDIGLCRVNIKTNEITFAGAQLPMIHYNGNEINEIQGTKLGIGGFIHNNEKKIFDQNVIQGKKNDIIFLFSDGYYSQFGGVKGKKLMKRRFSEVLLEIAKEPIDEQRKKLKDFYIDWKGKEEQVDDILVLGIQL